MHSGMQSTIYKRWSYNSSSSIFIDKYSSSSLNSLYDSPFAVSVSRIPKLSMRPLCSNTWDHPCMYVNNSNEVNCDASA